MRLLLKICVDNAQQTELGTYTLPDELPDDDEGFAKAGRKIVQRITECHVEYEAWRKQIDATCDCFAQKRSWDHPLKTQHSSECASWEANR